VPYGARQWARYTVRRSDGRPLVGPYLLVHYCVDGVCRTPVRVSLDRHGQATVRLYSTSSTWCSLVLPSTALPGQEFEAWYLVGTRAQTCTTVSAVAPAAVRHGRAFTVRATVLPSTDSVVDLQRLVGHTWKPDGRGWPGTGGRATISDVSTVLGPQYFRLRASGGPEMVPTTSRPFVVIGSMR
jgi:hypothetical protein